MHLGANDQADDIRGGMGLEGLTNLLAFVEQGGTLIVEGSTAGLLPAYGMVNGVSVEEPASLFVRGSILKSTFADKKSPIAYGYAGDVLSVYISQAPVLRVGGGAELGGGGGGAAAASTIPGVGMNITPNAVPD